MLPFLSQVASSRLARVSTFLMAGIAEAAADARSVVKAILEKYILNWIEGGRRMAVWNMKMVIEEKEKDEERISSDV